MSASVTETPAWWDRFYQEQYSSQDGPGRARRRMQQVLASLSAVERSYLASSQPRVAHVGCALGDGVDVLARAFPDARVIGTDCSPVAIAEAKRRFARREFHVAVEGELPGRFDVIVNTDRLRDDAASIATLQRQLAQCGQLYIACVPCDGQPDSGDGNGGDTCRALPEQLGGFQRIECKPIGADEPGDRPPQRMLIYAAEAYTRARPRRDDRLAEQEKWDTLYKEMPLADESKYIQEFNSEFAAMIRELLPDGGRVLEAGCGGGWQSLAVARQGKYDAHLMDFADEALSYSRRLFERAGVSASFHYGDINDAGTPEYDLVFNAGVLEHYPFDDQVRLLKGMASRSRKYVLVLVPNRLCYWYWLWRIQVQGHDQWPFGKEAPLADLSAVFEAAGLRFVGQLFTAESWTEAFIEQATGSAGDLQHKILEIHRSPVIPAASKGYLLAALGSVVPVSPQPARWQRFAWKEHTTESELYAAVGDALALRAATEQQLRRARDELAERDHEIQELTEQIARSDEQAAGFDAKLKELYEALDRKSAAAGQPVHDTERARVLDSPHEAELLAKIETLKVVIQRRDSAIAELRTQLRGQGKTATALRDEVDNRTRKHIELRSRLDKAEKRINELRSWTETLNVRFSEKAMEHQELEARLRAMTDTGGWKLVQLVYRVRYMLAPRGTWRDRLVKTAMYAQRRLRFHGRRGPVALARAIGGATRRGFRRATGAEQAGPLHAGLELARLDADAEPAIELPGLVSVVLPVYNQADMLSESIESALAQTYENFELIVVNDGATDGVERVLANYVGHPKVRLLTQQNQGLPKSLSNGFDFARGEFWTWTSADNLMEPEQLARHVEFLQANPTAAMVHSDYLAIDDRGQPLRDPNFRPHNRRTPDSPEIRLPRTTDGLSTRDDNFIGACFMYRAWVGRLIGEYTPNMGVEDYDYWMRVNELFTIRHLGTDDILYRYRVHDNTLCARAVEHGIPESVRRLMEHQRQRHAYYEQSWNIHVDDATRAWVRKLKTGAHTIRKLDESPANGAADAKSLVLIRADTLARLDEYTLPEKCCVAVWFDQEDVTAPYRLNSDIISRADVCFCDDARTLARLALFTRRAYHTAPGQTLFDLALAFANNNVFFDDTTATEVRARHLPLAFQPQDRRLRVLLQADNFMQGGFEQVVLDVAAVLDPQRFDVSILVVGSEGPAAIKAQGMGLKVLRLPPGDRAEGYRHLLTHERIDVVNPHYSVFGAAVACDLGIPFIQTIHSTYVWLTDQQIREHRAADPFTTAYLCVSSAAASYADLRYGFSPAKMLIVPNGIDAEALDRVRQTLDRARERRQLGFTDEHFVFLEVASIYPPKGQLLLVQALARALEHNPNIRVALLGRPMDERYTHRVREEARKLGVEHALKLLGYHEGAQKYYCLSDAFVLPSFCEGWSLALAEALYAGLPVISTDVGSAGDLLKITGGRLIAPPFESIVELDQNRLYRLVDGEHPKLVSDLTDALTTVADNPEPPYLTDQRRRGLDRRTAYEAYARIFQWAALGGAPTAARPWIRELHDMRK